MRLHSEDLQLASMKIQNFMGLEAFNMSLPPRGVVVVMGDSGKGKSSIIDAVHWVLSGKVFRPDGTHRPESGGTKTSVEITGHNFYATRTASKTTSELVWGYAGESPKSFTSPTLATAELQNLLGAADDWAVRNVVTTADLMFFSKSRDDERKRFLERVLNTHHYDKPHERLLKKVKEAKEAADEAGSEVDRLSGRLEALREQRESVTSPGDRPPAPERPSLAVREDLRRLQQPLLAEEELRALNQVVRQLEGWLDTLGAGTCPTCSSEVDHSHIKEHEKRLEAARRKAAKAKARLIQDREELLEAEEALRKELRAAQDAEASVSQWVQDKQRYDAMQATSADRIAEVELQLSQAQADLEQANLNVHFLKTCAEAVSVRGVRAWAVADVLGEIQQHANRYHQIMGSPFEVTISPTRSLANGKIVDEIDFKISGKGASKFKARAEGEQQRTGFAIRLAIAALYGGRGTLFLDEVFAHLNDSHIDGFAALINEVARDRSVVVITHDLAFAKALGGSLVRL